MMGTLSDEIVNTQYKDFSYKDIDVIEAEKIKDKVKELKVKIKWGLSHGNGDIIPISAVINHIDKIFGDKLT